MTKSFMRGISRATELTRSGKLSEATSLIQSLLDPGTAPAPAADKTRPELANGTVIDGTCTPVDTPAAGKPAKTKPSTSPRQGLRETLRSIAAGGMPASGLTLPGQGAARQVLPDGAQWLSLTHQGAQGSRAYRLYVPGASRPAPMPLVVMLHGCTQSPEDFALGTNMNSLAEEFGFLVAWPAQPQGANAQKCWNWFRPEDQARDRGEPALLAGVIRDILRDHPADAGRVYVAGLSAGGAAAAIMGAAYPDLVAAIGVHSGLAVGGAQDVMSAFGAMRSGAPGTPHTSTVPAIVFHGLADSTVHPGNGAAVIVQAVQAHPKLKRVQASGKSDAGRTFRHTRHEDAQGQSIAEFWEIEGAGHAWSGGQPGGSYTDPEGPDASREMLRFFAQHQRAA